MKHLATLFAMLMLCSWSPCPSMDGRGDPSVYICTGSGAYSYHNNRNCRGLNNCGGSIKQVTVSYAQSIGRKPCRICYKGK